MKYVITLDVESDLTAKDVLSVVERALTESLSKPEAHITYSFVSKGLVASVRPPEHQEDGHQITVGRALYQSSVA